VLGQLPYMPPGCCIHLSAPDDFQGRSAGLALCAALLGVVTNDVAFSGGWVCDDDGDGMSLAMLGGLHQKMMVSGKLVTFIRSFSSNEWDCTRIHAEDWFLLDKVDLEALDSGVLPIRSIGDIKAYFDRCSDESKIDASEESKAMSSDKILLKLRQDPEFYKLSAPHQMYELQKAMLNDLSTYPKFAGGKEPEWSPGSLEAIGKQRQEEVLSAALSLQDLKKLGRIAAKGAQIVGDNLGNSTLSNVGQYAERSLSKSKGKKTAAKSLLLQPGTVVAYADEQDVGDITAAPNKAKEANKKLASQIIQGRADVVDREGLLRAIPAMADDSGIGAGEALGAKFGGRTLRDVRKQLAAPKRR